jgi:Fic-DOC domain mobile mystery protein B
VTGQWGDDPDGATPLEPDQTTGLRPSWVATRSDLNIAEEQNIATATQWASTRNWSAGQILNERALLGLHRRMFSQVWRWAGTWRSTQTNIGLEAHLIKITLRQLLDDTTTWLEYQSYPADEVAVRFHHRLVWIHPFPNGNGRHARLAADILAISLRRPVFSWGAQRSAADGGRVEYLAALRRADTEYDYSPLLQFARS